MVKSESIQRILDVGAGATRIDLLLAATRELTILLGERGVCILLEGTPRIAVAPSDPMAEGRSVELGEHAEIAEALRVRDLVVAEDGSSIAVPLCGGGCCLGVVLVQSNHPRPGVCLDLATARLVARLTAALLRGAVELEGAILAPMALSPSMPISVALLQPATARRRILVVEDDVDLAEALGEGLESEGYLVEQDRKS